MSRGTHSADRTVDLTNGKPSSVLFRFALPMLFSVLLQQLYVLVDLFIVGNCTDLPETAVASVAAASSVTAIYTAIAVGLNTGCSVLIARLFGGKQYARMHTAVKTALLGALCIGTLLTVGGELLCEPLLRLIHTPKSAFAGASTYLRIYTASLPFVFLYNIGTGICNALGDSKTPLYFLAGSSGLNVALDVLFVQVFRWNAPGAAWATLIAQCACALLLMLVLTRRLRRLEGKNAPWVQRDILQELVSLSVPTVMQQTFVAVGNFLIQRVIDGLGSDSTIAGFSAALKINAFATGCFVTVSAAIASFTAQNVGAGETERVKKGFSAGVRMLYALILPVACLFVLLAPVLVRLFLSEAKAGDVQAAVDAGGTFLRMVAPFYLIIAVKIAIDGILRGHGAMKYFTASTIADLILRVFLCYLLAFLQWGNYAIPVAWAVGWTVACLLAFLFYRKRVWER